MIRFANQIKHNWYEYSIAIRIIEKIACRNNQ